MVTGENFVLRRFSVYLFSGVEVYKRIVSTIGKMVDLERSNIDLTPLL